MAVAKRPGPSATVALSLMIVAAVAGLPAFVLAVAPFVRTIETKPITTPVTVERHLDHETYEVYEYTGSAGFLPTASDATDLSASQIVVTASGGAPLAVGAPDDSDAISRGGKSYTSVAEFDVPSGGTYQVSVQSDRPDVVIIAPSPVAQFRAALPWFGAAALAGLLFVLGTILLIVGSVRRNRAPRPWAPGWGPPGGGQGWGPPGAAPPGWGPPAAPPGWGAGPPPAAPPGWGAGPPPAAPPGWGAAPPPAPTWAPPPGPPPAPPPAWGAPPAPAPAESPPPPEGWGYTGSPGEPPPG